MRPVAYPSRGSGAVALVGVAMMSSGDGPRMRARRKNSAVVMRSSVADGGGQGLSWQPNRSVTRRTARIARKCTFNSWLLYSIRGLPINQTAEEIAVACGTPDVSIGSLCDSLKSSPVL
uniref:Uncharacterized protein n=1 Tax=Timema bartmani TaxID=61472 RepID=A0A7R9EX32_9NEOP|nr:unnamed protein product [Timema bartmani]